MKILTYRGETPKILDPEDRKQILGIMSEQLKILKLMSQSVCLIEEGVRIKELDLDMEKEQ